MRAWFGPPLYVSAAAGVFDAELKLVDADIRRQLEQLLAQFVQAIG
jgi:hypothetical protein